MRRLLVASLGTRSTILVLPSAIIPAAMSALCLSVRQRVSNVVNAMQDRHILDPVCSGLLGHLCHVSDIFIILSVSTSVGCQHVVSISESRCERLTVRDRSFHYDISIPCDKVRRSPYACRRIFPVLVYHRL